MLHTLYSRTHHHQRFPQSFPREQPIPTRRESTRVRACACVRVRVRVRVRKRMNVWMYSQKRPNQLNEHNKARADLLHIHFGRTILPAGCENNGATMSR
jgi:hypothetical protein